MGFSIFQGRVFRAIGSLRLSLWLLAAQLMLFLAGAIQMPLSEYYRSMNTMPLFEWMRIAPPVTSWWLWASVAVMVLLALNTLFCGVESIFRKGAGKQWFQVLPPQAIHAGFLLMLAGHLASSAGAMHEQYPMREGSAVMIPGGYYMRLGEVELDLAPMGYPLDWRARLEYYSSAGDLMERGVAAPNRPSFPASLGGLGVYVKQAAYGGALMEVHREPGTLWALGGGALFTLGTIALTGLKMRREK